MKYAEELKRSMNYMGKKPKSIFLGQAVEYAGTAMTNTLKEVPKNKLYEFPVTEEMQMGVTIGLLMQDFIPISIYPRWNFLLYGINQLVNHIDKFKIMTGVKKVPKLIIRTGIGSRRPLHPQHQHIGDFSNSIQKMCTSLEIIKLNNPKDIFPAYKKAYERKDGKNTILVEYGDYYNEK